MMNRLFLIMATALSLSACAAKKEDFPAQERVPAIDLANLDTTVSPADDFYRYATGGWQKNNPLKPEYARFGSFDALRDLSQERLNDLFQNMSSMKTVPGSPEDKIVILYNQGMDSEKLNSDGGAPLKKYLDLLYSVSDRSEMIQAVAVMHDAGLSPFFEAYAQADLTDSNVQIAYFGQSGLGIGDRDYYLDPKNEAIREGYRSFLVKVFTLSGIADPQKAASNALEVETVIAEHFWTRVQQRDVVASYNPMSSDEAAAKYPGLDLTSYLRFRNIPAQKKIVVDEPSYFEAMSDYLATADLGKVKDYLAGQIIKDACNELSDDYYSASFDFFSTQLSGVKEQKPRWKRAMTPPNSILGEAVGKMYVAKYFPETSKEKMLTLVDNLKAALSEHIAALDWMGDATKAKAQEKLAAFTVKIGYPDKWKDYSTLVVRPENSYYENLLAASRWYVEENKAKIGQPTDRTEWQMTPQTVNAYYNPTTNEICFPAAILQPPFFNPDADDAVNYGGIGVVIGHEMSHGFDDQGRQFDKDGNMTNWWTDEDAARFNEKAKILIAQFDEVEILPGLNADGKLSLGENIGDHGGLSVAFSAMQNAISGSNPGLIDGFTPEQRFYLSYGAIWAQNITDEEKARLTKLDVHSLAVNRVNVSVKNFQSFFDAFGIKEGDRMWRPESERVSIW